MIGVNKVEVSGLIVGVGIDPYCISNKAVESFQDVVRLFSLVIPSKFWTAGFEGYD